MRADRRMNVLGAGGAIAVVLVVGACIVLTSASPERSPRTPRFPGGELVDAPPDPRFEQRPPVYPTTTQHQTVEVLNAPIRTEEAERRRLVDTMESLGRSKAHALEWWDRLDGRFSNPTVRAIAATLAGSFAEPALEALVDDGDWSDVVVRPGMTWGGENAAEQACETGPSLATIVLGQPVMESSLPAAASTLLHELLHVPNGDDDQVESGRQEHTVVHWVGTMIYAEFLAADPTLADEDDSLTTSRLSYLRDLLGTFGDEPSASGASGYLGRLSGPSPDPSWSTHHVWRLDGEEAESPKPDAFVSIVVAAVPGLAPELARTPGPALTAALRGWGPIDSAGWVRIFDALGARPAPHRDRAGVVTSAVATLADLADMSPEVAAGATEFTYVVEVTNFDSLPKPLSFGYRSGEVVFDVSTFRRIDEDGTTAAFPDADDRDRLQILDDGDTGRMSTRPILPGHTVAYAVDARRSVPAPAGEIAYASVKVGDIESYPSVWLVGQPAETPAEPAVVSPLGSINASWSTEEDDGEIAVVPGGTYTVDISVTGAGHPTPVVLRLGVPAGFTIDDVKVPERAHLIDGSPGDVRLDADLAPSETLVVSATITLDESFVGGEVDMSVQPQLIDPFRPDIPRARTWLGLEEGCIREPAAG